MLGFGSTIFAVKLGRFGAREVASCQKVLGGREHSQQYGEGVTVRDLINGYKTNSFIISEGRVAPFRNLDYLFLPDICKAVEEKRSEITAYVVDGAKLRQFSLKLGAMTDDEREIILKGLPHQLLQGAIITIEKRKVGFGFVETNFSLFCCFNNGILWEKMGTLKL